jgi:hypothetical protein
MEDDPDPALDPDLAMSQQHAGPGSMVVVTATIRNLGRSLATGLSIQLYAGTPVTGTLLAAENISNPLQMNDAISINFDVPGGSGEQPLTAELTTTGEDLDPHNNQASCNLSEIPAPTLIAVYPRISNHNALQLVWTAPQVQGVAGYRILRGENPGGPYELVGEAERTSFIDTLLDWDKTYYYIIQAFDEAGIRSLTSQEMDGVIPSIKIYLPLIQY